MGRAAWQEAQGGASGIQQVRVRTTKGHRSGDKTYTGFSSRTTTLTGARSRARPRWKPDFGVQGTQGSDSERASAHRPHVSWGKQGDGVGTGGPHGVSGKGLQINGGPVNSFF